MKAGIAVAEWAVLNPKMQVTRTGCESDWLPAGSKRWSRFMVPLFILSLLTPLPGWTESPSSPPSASPPRSDRIEDQILFQEIPSVYAASKYEQKVTEAPSSVSIVTAEEIRRFGYRTLADILRSVRGFYVNYDRNYSYIGVRGFSRSGDWNSRVLILVDGHRLNDGIYDSVLIGTDFILDVDLVDRVEIVRGPSSSLYGSNAFFGVVNVITKRGRDLKGPEAAASVGGLQTYTGRLSYGQRFQNGLEPLLSASYLSSQGQQRLFFREFNDPSTNSGVVKHRDGDRAYSIFNKLDWHDFTLSAAYNSRDKEIPTASYGTLFNDPRAETTDQRGFINLKYERTVVKDWAVLGRLFYDRYYYRGLYPYQGTVTDTVLNEDSANAESAGLEAQLTTTALASHTITAGTEFRADFRQDLQNFDRNPFVEYLDSHRDSTHWSVFVQDAFAVLPKLTLHGGLRYDYYESFGGSLNPRVGVIYTPVPETIVKALYGTAFRAPNAYEQSWSSAIQKPSRNLEPETITTYELILEQYLARYLRGTAVGFYYTIDNLINLVTDPADSLLVYRNQGEIRAHGIELELEGRWSNGLLGRVSYTYQRTEDGRTGQVLTDSPQHLAKFNVSIPLIRDLLFGGVEVQYVSERKVRTGKELDGFVLTNLTLFSLNLPVKGFEISATVYNVFGTQYADPASEEHRQTAIEQDGRSFRFKLQYAF
jgi:outer membrane receptor for ferrienterochelin and colicins